MKNYKTRNLTFLLVVAGFLAALGAHNHSTLAQTATKESSLLALDPKYAKISTAIATKLKGATPLQTSNDLDELYKQAEVADKELRNFITEIAKQTHGQPAFGRLKGRARSEEKIKADYGGNASRLLDIARGTIKFDTVDDLYKALAKIDSSPDVKIVRIKDRFSKPAEGGYRDLLLNLKLPSGFITELQLNLSQIIAIKKQGHQIYKVMRELDEKVAIEKRDFTPAEVEQKKRLVKESEALYDQAFQSASKKKE